MNTGTAATRAAASEAWTPVLSAAGAQGRQLGEQILQVAHQVAVRSEYHTSELQSQHSN